MRKPEKTARSRAHTARLVLAASLAVLFLVALPGAASAATVADCQAKIEQLRAQSATVAISGRNADRDRAGLLGKLDEASAKLATGKNADAVQKLDDFRVKVQQLEASGHVATGDAQPLIAGADDAIACIGSLPA